MADNTLRYVFRWDRGGKSVRKDMLARERESIRSVIDTTRARTLAREVRSPFALLLPPPSLSRIALQGIAQRACGLFYHTISVVRIGRDCSSESTYGIEAHGLCQRTWLMESRRAGEREGTIAGASSCWIPGRNARARSLCLPVALGEQSSTNALCTLAPFARARESFCHRAPKWNVYWIWILIS